MIKKTLNKIKFSLGLDPIIEKRNDWQRFIPDGYKSVLLIYADFELAWAWRFVKNLNNPFEYAKEMGMRERNNIPTILDVHNKFDIPVTFATVGHLFLNNCEFVDGKKHSEILRLNHFENEYWKFDKGDWFDSDPTGNYESNREYYCPDLIDSILNSKVKHEIGCHTFSHIDCTDKICPVEVFESEIYKCIELANEKNLNLKTFVHPAHTIGNLNSLIKTGFTSYRTDYKNILGFPNLYNNKLWQIKSTWEYVVFNEWSIDYHIKRYIQIIDRAIKSNTVCVLWFHPSMNIRFFEEIAPAIYQYINDNHEKILPMTASHYTSFLNERSI